MSSSRRVWHSTAMLIWAGSVAIGTHEALATDTLSLAIQVKPSEGALHVGDPLVLQVRYANTSADPLILLRSTDLGLPGTPGSLGIVAKRGDCAYEVRQTHFEYEVGASRFFHVPLWPGRALEEEIRLNDTAGSFMELPLREAGRYILMARLVSKPLDSPEGSLWQGEALSSPVEVTVAPPRSELVARRRVALERCIAESCEALDEHVNYFRLVRDGKAATVLAALLGERPRPLIAEAVAAQGRREDSAVLRLFASKIPESSRQYYENLADELELGGSCK